MAPPSSWAYAWWALVMLLLDLSYTAVVCPISVAFAPRDALITWAFILDFVAGLLFLCDIAVNFHVGYVAQVRSHRDGAGVHLDVEGVHIRGCQQVAAITPA